MSSPPKGNTSSEVQRDQQTENWSKLSFILRIFLPVAGLFIFFKQKHIFSRLLLQLDRNCVSVFCPSFSRREKLLKWAGGRLPETWSSQSRTLAGGVAELWSDGSLLCTLINSAIPGACPNPHRHWKKPPLHAQAVAYKYLGVIPIFTDNDLRGRLTISLERSFLHYLNELQQAIVKLSERNDIPRSVSLYYIARGMGLYSGEQHRKTVFYVYPNKDSTGYNSNIIVHIRGPYATYGKAIIPKFHNDLFTTPEINVTTDLMTTKKLLNGTTTTPKNSFMKNFSLPFMQYHKKHMGDNIVIHVTMEDDRAKVTYIPKNYGMYEIIMVSNGELIRGCPFNIHVLNNVSGIEDSFDSEEKIDDILGLRKRKILSKTIDFIDEQIPIADVLKRYKKKEDVEPHVEHKETASIAEEEIDSLDGIITPPEESIEIVNIMEQTYKEEDFFFDKLINEDATKSKLNLSSSVPELKSESVAENEDLMITSTKLLVPNGDVQPRATRHHVNHSNDNASGPKVINNDTSMILELKPKTESVNNQKDVTDILDCKKQIFNVVSNANSDTVNAEPSSRKIQVNKIKIPEKFCQQASNTDFGNELDTKYFKNVINACNKRELPKNAVLEDNIKYTNKIINDLQSSTVEDSKNDDNNNNISFNIKEVHQNVEPVYQRNSNADEEKVKGVPRRFLEHQQHLQSSQSSLNDSKSTSPICLDHIDSEVENEFMKISVAERRKIFSRKFPDQIAPSTNSSFSETENAENSSNRRPFKHFEGLSVMNYLGSLKKSQGRSNREVYPLCSTMSLPNILATGNENFRSSVKERRNFWERVSTSSSSLSINSEMSLKRPTKKLTEIERSRLIWKKPDEVTASNTSINTLQENSDLEKNVGLSKSADDILSISNVVPHQDGSKKYKSMDNSLDNCTMMTIEERKKMLLKQNYEKENQRKDTFESWKNEKINETRKKFVNKSLGITKNGDQESDVVVFGSVLERIKKYDSACNLSNKIVEEEPKISQDITPDNNTKTTTSKSNEAEAQKNSHPPEILTVKSHFKRAIKYFKNLEEKSLNKSKTNPLPKDCRRYSLDMQPNKYRSHRKGGSLNLPNVSQRFSVNNLYKDVFGDRRGSFKGAANRSALVEALATFSRTENHNFSDENNIMYEMFQKKAKTKRRRSIRSIFDIYY